MERALPGPGSRAAITHSAIPFALIAWILVDCISHHPVIIQPNTWFVTNWKGMQDYSAETWSPMVEVVVDFQFMTLEAMLAYNST